MVTIRYIFAHVFAVSCLLAILIPTTATADENEDKEELDAWLESLLKTFQTTTPAADDDDQAQQPTNYYTQDQQQEPSFYFTEEQSNYIKKLLAKSKLDNLNDNVKQELKNHLLQASSEEEEEQKQQETGVTNDDSDEEETTLEPTTESTTTTETTTTTTTPTETTTTTTTPTETTTTTTERTTKTTTPIPVCFGYKPDTDIRFYLQYDGLYWLKRSCPDGYGFDYNACACSIKLESTVPVTTTPETRTTTTTTPETTTTTTTTPETTTTTTPETTTTTTTTQKVTTAKPSLELCNDCVILHGVGYAPFPGYCDAFIQCRFYGDVPTSINIRRCPSGYYWNQDKLTCDFQDNVKCVSVNNCPNHKVIPGDWAAYLIFDGQNWNRMSCPSSTTYNSITCGCTDKHDDNDDSSHETCLDKKAISEDKTGYLQLTGNGWVRMPCPATVGYNEQTCSCTEILVPDSSYSRCPDKKAISGDTSAFLQFNGVSWLRIPCPKTLAYNSESCICTYTQDQSNDADNDDSESKDKDLCKSAVTLTFNNDDATDSSVNQFWVNNTGVSFKDGKAYFNGKSRLTIPGLSNIEFGSTVYIFIKYRHTSASSQETLIANGDCQVRQSLAICSGKESVDFYAETTQQISIAKITVPSDIGTWQTAVYALENDSLQGSVGANKVSQPVKGSLDRRQRGIVIGGGGNCDNFHGIIDEVEIFLCKPNFTN